MVPFAGYDLPVQYPTGILKEHLRTRAGAGLFDVSHMGQVVVSGDDAGAALESLVPMALIDLGEFRQRYCLLTNDVGGIRDDLMVTRRESDFFVVVNAACKAEDTVHMQSSIGNHCRIEPLESRALLALQGPRAVEALGELNAGVADLKFMEGSFFDLTGDRCFVTRSGYTGEDGFEISIAADHAETLARLLLKHPGVTPAGLGARDSLRLEAGLCLYGHDIDTTTTPVAARLAWSIQKARRAGGEREGGFPGAAVILDELANGAARSRVGIRATGRAPVREGAPLENAAGEVIGVITSGGFGPTVNGPVAMGYVDTGLATPGTALIARVRNRPIDVEVHKLPFVPQRFAR